MNQQQQENRWRWNRSQQTQSLSLGFRPAFAALAESPAILWFYCVGGVIRSSLRGDIRTLEASFGVYRRFHEWPDLEPFWKV